MFSSRFITSPPSDLSSTVLMCLNYHERNGRIFRGIKHQLRVFVMMVDRQMRDMMLSLTPAPNDARFFLRGETTLYSKGAQYRGGCACVSETSMWALLGIHVLGRKLRSPVNNSPCLPCIERAEEVVSEIKESRTQKKSERKVSSGRLYQVEYAMEAIGNAGSAIGILAKDGVVLIGEKKVTSKLLQTSTSAEKMYKIDDHVACAVAGIMSDANILINTARVQAQRYTFMYQEPMPVEQLVQSLCDTKQGYTQFGGLRPFGVSFLFAGWDKNH
ncbi:hypothetical protein IGI04_018775, partial [Brassica rapa subsp. trilocularis]